MIFSNSSAKPPVSPPKTSPASLRDALPPGAVTLDHPDRLARVLREMGDLEEGDGNERAFQLIADLGAHASVVLTHDAQGELLRSAIRQAVEKANEDESVVTLEERTEGAFDILEITFDEQPDAPVRLLAAISENRALCPAVPSMPPR